MSSVVLSRLGAAYRLELRLICLHWTYPLLHLAWGVFVIAGLTNITSRGAEYLMFTLSLGIIPLITLAAMVFAALSASRSTRTHFDPLEMAYPTGAEILIARWLAVVTAVSGFLIIPTGIALVNGPLDTFFRTLPVFLFENVVLFALVAAGVWLIQITIGIKRWIYPLFAVVWLGSAIVPSTLNVELFPVSLLLAFAAQGWLNTAYSEIWGRLTIGSLPLYHDLFYLSLMLLSLGIIIWRSTTRRFYRHALPAVLLAVVAGCAASFAAISYSSDVVAANTQAKDNGQVIRTHRDNIILPADVSYAVDTYSITLDLNDFRSPRFHVQMQIVNQGSQPLSRLDFSLNRQFDVTESTVPHERDDDYLYLTPSAPLLPGEMTYIDLSYAGDFWYYDGSLIQGRPREVRGFIRAGGVNLPCAVAWYPVPGRIVVGRTFLYDGQMERSVSDCLIPDPAQFTLHVESSGSLRFASNLPATAENQFAARSTWVHLIGAPELVTQGRGDLTLVTVQPMLDQVEPLVMAHYPSALEHFRRFFPDIEGLTIMVVDAGFDIGFQQIATPATDGRLVVVVDPTYLSAFPTNPYNEYLFAGQSMIYSLFEVGEDHFSGNNSYVENVGFFLWAHYLAAGDPDQMLVTPIEDIPQGSVGRRSYFSQSVEERYPIAHLLYDVYLEQGEPAIIALLGRIYAERGTLDTLTTEEAFTWIRDAANAA